MKTIVVFCMAIAGAMSAYVYNKPTYGSQPVQNKPTYNNQYVPAANKYNPSVPLPALNKHTQNVALPTFNKYNQKPVASTYIPVTRNEENENKDKEATIIRYESTNDGKGNYEFEYETSDGQIRKERGELIQVDGAEDPVVKVSGSYTYRDPENKSHTVNYVADENGYRAMEESTRRKIVPQTAFSSPIQPLSILGSVSKTIG